MDIRHVTEEEKQYEKVQKMTQAQVQSVSGINTDYGQRVDALIRQKYSLADEIALSRQRDEKPAEWESYYTYCEECKQQAKEPVDN